MKETEEENTIDVTALRFPRSKHRDLQDLYALKEDVMKGRTTSDKDKRNLFAGSEAWMALVSMYMYCIIY